MTGFDYTVLGVLGISFTLGVWRGFIREIFALVAWVGAFYAAYHLGDMGAQALHAVFKDPLVRTLCGYGLVFIGVLLLASGLGALLQMLIKAAGLGFTDRALGAAFGLMRGLMIVLLGVLLAGLTSLPEQPWWQDAKFSPPLETAVLASKPWLPKGVAERIRYQGR